MEFLHSIWEYRFPLVPVATIFVIFDLPAIFRRLTRIAYTPIYFMFFPLGHSDELYAQYFHENEEIPIRMPLSDDQLAEVKRKIIATSVISMSISTVLSPVLAGFTAAFLLDRFEFISFLWALIIIKLILISYSLFKTRYISFIYTKKNSMYIVASIYIIYLVIIWRLLFIVYGRTYEKIEELGIYGAIIEAMDTFIVEIFVYLILVSAITWALTVALANKPNLKRVERFRGEIDE